MMQALLMWPLTPLAVAAACSLFFYHANGGFRQPASDAEAARRARLPRLAFMVFVMSLAVILAVRFLADVPCAEQDARGPRHGSSRPRGASAAARSGAGKARGGATFYGGHSGGYAPGPAPGSGSGPGYSTDPLDYVIRGSAPF